MLEELLLKPATVPCTPVLLARKDPTVPQKKGADLLLMHPDRLHCCRTRPDQVPHCLVRRIGHPHCGQLAGPQQPRQRYRITPVRLDPITRLARYERWSNHNAGVAEFGDQPMQAIAGRPSLVTAMQAIVLGCQLGQQPPHAFRRGVDLAEIPNIAIPASVGQRYRVAQFRRIDPDECCAALSRCRSSRL